MVPYNQASHRQGVVEYFPDILRKDEDIVDIVCNFNKFNKECKRDECPYFKSNL